MEKFSQNRTHCPILNTCFEVYSHIINDLCFWHGVCPVKAVKVEAMGKEEFKAILNMDRKISKEVQRKEQRKQFIRIGTAVGGFIVLIVVVISMLQTSLKRKDLNISTVDKGVIEVSVSASGKVIPAFEEIINSPINSRIVEVYKRGGDSVDVGTPILKLDLQSAETEYNKQLDEEQMKSLQLEQQRVTNHNKLSEMEMNLKVSRMELDRKAVELRNERYLDSLGAGTTDKVRQVELDYNVSILKLKEDEQKYKNEQRWLKQDLKVKELELNIFRKSLAETRRTLEDAQIRSPRKAILTYVNNEMRLADRPGSEGGNRFRLVSFQDRR